MANVIFYEKPGCGGNARQKALLIASGHTLDVRDLLRHAWTAEELRPYFGDRPISDWFNPAAPRVKSGEIRPDQLDEQRALALMVSDPLLIRRPLLQSAGRRECGFDSQRISDWIGLSSQPIHDIETCTKPAGTQTTCASKVSCLDQNQTSLQGDANVEAGPRTGTI